MGKITGSEFELSFRDKTTGQMQPALMFVANADKTLAEIKTYADGQKTEMQTYTQQQKQALQQKATETIAAIPSDYTTLSNDVSDLKEDLDTLANRLKSGSLADAELHLGLYIDADGDICQKEE